MTAAREIGTDATGELVVAERRGSAAWIRINRPEKLNALSTEVMSAVRVALDEAERSDDVSVVVLTGTASSFSVGYDIAEEVSVGLSHAEDWHTALANNIDLTMKVWGFAKPVIAAVNGWCLAGGCELAMACDMVIAARSARFGEPEIRFGSGPVTLLMPYVLGQKVTNELLLTGDTIDADAAVRLGLANRVVDDDALEAEVERLVERIALAPLPILRLTKRAIVRAYEAMGLRDAVDSNLDIAAVLNGTHTEERAEFTRLVATEGLRAALDWRDRRYATAETEEH